MGHGLIDVSSWAQGDCCLDVGSVPAVLGDQIVEIEASGVMLVSQTCDIVRTYAERSYVQVARLIKANVDEVEAVRRFRLPRYAYVPTLADSGLVADLDIVATVDKVEVARWLRTPGCQTEIERRELGYALGRHKTRFAFPDSCSIALSKLRSWVIGKQKKASDEGQFVRALLQMRLWSSTDFEAPAEVEIICILDDGAEPELRTGWTERMLPKIAAMIDPAWCGNVKVRLTTTAEMSVDEYLGSYRLDFDALTIS